VSKLLVTIGGDPGTMSCSERLVRQFASPPGDAMPQEHLDHRRHDSLAGLFCAAGSTFFNLHTFVMVYINPID